MKELHVPVLEDLVSNSFEENEAIFSKLSVRKHFASRPDLILASSTVFARLRMSERAMLLKSVVDFARGGVEEEGEEENEREEEEEEEKKKKSERTGTTTAAATKKKISQTKIRKKKTMDFLGGGGGSYAKKSGEDEDDGSASLVTKAISEEDAMKFLELAEKCVLFAKEKEEYEAHLANASALAKKAFAVVARSYVKTLREMGVLERALEPLKYALKTYSNVVSRGKVTFLHAVCYETCVELKRENEAYDLEDFSSPWKIRPKLDLRRKILQTIAITPVCRACARKSTIELFRSFHTAFRCRRKRSADESRWRVITNCSWRPSFERVKRRRFCPRRAGFPRRHRMWSDKR
jgi:hypothetical protein